MNGLGLWLKYTLSTYARIGYPADSEKLNVVCSSGFPRIQHMNYFYKHDILYPKYLWFVILISFISLHYWS